METRCLFYLLYEKAATVTTKSHVDLLIENKMSFEMINLLTEIEQLRIQPMCKILAKRNRNKFKVEIRLIYLKFYL